MRLVRNTEPTRLSELDGFKRGSIVRPFAVRHCSKYIERFELKTLREQ